MARNSPLPIWSSIESRPPTIKLSLRNNTGHLTRLLRSKRSLWIPFYAHGDHLESVPSTSGQIPPSTKPRTTKKGTAVDWKPSTIRGRPTLIRSAIFKPSESKTIPIELKAKRQPIGLPAKEFKEEHCSILNLQKMLITEWISEGNCRRSALAYRQWRWRIRYGSP